MAKSTKQRISSLGSIVGELGKPEVWSGTGGQWSYVVKCMECWVPQRNNLPDGRWSTRAHSDMRDYFAVLTAWNSHLAENHSDVASPPSIEVAANWKSAQ